MSHSCVFSLGILEIFNSCILSPSLKCPRGCLTRGTHFYVKSAWMWDCCWYHVVFYHCIVSCLAMWHSRIFSFEILNRCIVLRVSYAWNLFLRKNCVDVRFLCIVSRVIHARDTCEDILERAKLCSHWGFPRPLDWRSGSDTSLIEKPCNGRKVHDIDTTFQPTTHFSRRNFSTRLTPERKKLGVGEPIPLLRISKITRLKTGLWNIAKNETMQWNKTTGYRQQCYIHALFT